MNQSQPREDVLEALIAPGLQTEGFLGGSFLKLAGRYQACRYRAFTVDTILMH
jgi:hypothetical protein